MLPAVLLQQFMLPGGRDITLPCASSWKHVNASFPNPMDKAVIKIDCLLSIAFVGLKRPFVNESFHLGEPQRLCWHSMQQGQLEQIPGKHVQ